MQWLSWADKTRLIVLICIAVAVAASLVIGYFLSEARKSEYVKTFENSFCVATTDDYPSSCLKNYLGKDVFLTNRQMMKALSNNGLYKMKEETTDSGVTYVTASFTMDSKRIDYMLSYFGLEELDNAKPEVELRFGFDAGTNYTNMEFIFPIFIINEVPRAQDAGTRELYGFIFQIAAILRASDPNDNVINLAARTFAYEIYVTSKNDLVYYDGTSLRFYYDNRSVCLESDSDRILEYIDGQYTDVYF